MAKEKKFTITNSVWLWPGGVSPWHFIYVDGKVKDNIVAVAKKHHMGFIKVRATLGQTTWETSLFPHKKESCYLLAIKKKVREAEGIFKGDKVTVEIVLI